MGRKIWVIADTHFYHAALVDYCGRPPDFSERIIYHWRKMVLPDDLVYHLGDVYFGPKSKFRECITSLPGQKILIKGNHDRLKTSWYMDNGFVAVMDQATAIINIKVRRGQMCGFRIIFSHRPVPIPVVEHDKYITFNIHGHFHNNKTIKCERKLVDSLTDHHYLLAMEETGYKPILLQNMLLQESLLEGR